MVLPSNASPAIYPQNNASDFTVSWENNIELNPDERWAVALTEISYVYKASTIRPNYGIRYQQYKRNDYYLSVSLAYSLRTHEVYHNYFAKTSDGYPFKYSDYPFEFKMTPEMRLMVISNHPFEMYFPTDMATALNWVQPHSVISGNKYICCSLPYIDEKHFIHGDPYSLGYAKIYVFSKESHVNMITLNEHVSFSTLDELTQYLHRKCMLIFHNVTHDGSKIHLTMHSTVNKVEFLNDLHFVLGLSNNNFRDESAKMIQGVTPVNLARGVMNMFIYASICEPIFVGHVLAPLLKHVFIDCSKDESNNYAAKNSVIMHPMYIPVAFTSINEIVINIRDELGELINFPAGSITTLTLHFRRG